MIQVKTYNVYSIKDDEVFRIGAYTYDEKTARSLGESRKKGKGSQGREVVIVPVSLNGKEDWSKKVDL
jgi:hypothetical protein